MIGSKSFPLGWHKSAKPMSEPLAKASMEQSIEILDGNMKPDRPKGHENPDAAGYKGILSATLEEKDGKKNGM